MMNRTTEGLVQRRTAAAAAASKDNNGSNNSNDRTPLTKNDSDDDTANGSVAGGGAYGSDFDADSKETRLTLMEEVLLLGLKDKEVLIIIVININ